MGATNRDDNLDAAVTRPGRLDRKVYIDNPTEMEREDIFKIHMIAIKIKENLKENYAARLAACTPGLFVYLFVCLFVYVLLKVFNCSKMFSIFGH